MGRRHCVYTGWDAGTSGGDERGTEGGGGREDIVIAALSIFKIKKPKIMVRHDNLPVSGWFDAAYWRALNPSCTVTESAELGGAGPAQLPTPVLERLSVIG